MDKLHLRENNRWENNLDTALVSFQHSLDQKPSPQSITRYKSVLAWSPPMGKGRGVCLKTMVSIHIFPSDQKSCIDSRLLNILVKKQLIFLTVFWSQQVFIWHSYLFPAHCRDPWVKEDAFVHLSEQGKAAKFFSCVSYPSQADKPKGQVFKRSSVLTVSTWSMVRPEEPRAMSAPKALQMHQTWKQIRFGETKWHTSTLIF